MGRTRVVLVLLNIALILVALQCGHSTGVGWADSVGRAEDLFSTGRYLESASAARQLLRDAEMSTPRDSVRIGTAALILGKSYMGLRRYVEAETAYARAVRVLDSRPPRLELSLAQGLAGLGCSRSAQHKDQAAIEPLQRAIRIREALGLARGVDHCVVLSYLGQSLQSLGHSRLAVSSLEEGVRIGKQVYLAEPSKLAPALETLAGAYSDLGKTDTAEALYRQALELLNVSLNPTEEELIALSLVARFYQAQGRAAPACSLFQEALDITEKVYPNNPRELAISSYDLGNCFREAGYLDRAETLIVAADEVLSRSSYSGDSHRPRALLYMALLRADQRRIREADSLFHLSLSVTIAILGDKTVSLAEDLETYARFLVSQKRYPEAEASYRRAIAVTESTRGPNYWKLAQSYDDLARVLEKLGKKPEMLEARKRADRIRSNPG